MKHMLESDSNVPKVEDDILELLDGEVKEAALKFAAHANVNQLAPKRWRPRCWKIPHNGCHLCMIQLEPNTWRLTFFFGDYNGKFDERFVAVVHEHVRICTRCHDGCTFGKDTTVFGKEFKNVCSQLTLQFENPNNDALECAKALLEHVKKNPPGNDSWHAHH